MYPTISDLIRDLFGIHIPLPIQSFGFFVAIAFLLASWLLAKELKRKEEEGFLQPITKKVLKGAKATTTEMAISGIIGFVIGFKLLDIILNYSDFVLDPQFFILSFKGNIFGALIGAAAGIYLKYTEKNKEKADKPFWQTEVIHPHQHVGNITLISAFVGILGAKIFHNLENPGEFIADPIGALLSFSGLTMYGGLICGAFAIIWYARKNNLTVTRLFDAGAPGLMLAYGVGRIGCHISGDGDWGVVNNAPKPNWMSFLPDWIWAYDYPNNVIKEGIPIPDCIGSHCFVLPEPVWPTAFYEAALSIMLFGFLWSIRKKITIPGMLFSIYLVLNGFERFFIEKIRVNEVYNILGFHPTQAEIISVGLILLGIAGMFYFNKKYKDNLAK
ncbi:MAG: prolipoprotein diacylglyceryl transferase [Bacteroidetes bacterium]|nr:prolipoprotein diacylglyceryl transferase [Bacteroidota bacterium]HET6243402.1 prolipoprotein diacylglyceryl transferase family protein [Bacteroidia bacterium]